MYSKVEESPTPKAGSTCRAQAVQLRYHHLPSPILTRPPYCAVCHQDTVIVIKSFYVALNKRKNTFLHD